MTSETLGIAAVWALIGAFGISGVVQLAAPRLVRDAYRRWDYRRDAHRFVATVDLITAGLIIHPETRAWGLAAAGLVLFGAVVTLLGDRKYAHALPGIVLLLALAPAARTVLS
jgi:hypothetical protein